jgi:hypothetical protein
MKTKMTDIVVARLPLHFDVPQNYLPTEDYVVALQSLKATLDEFNKRLFNSKLKYEFITIGAEQGSYKGIMGILTLTVCLFSEIIQFLETDTAKGIVKAIIGKEIDYKDTAENSTIFLRDLLIGFYITVNEKLEQEIPQSINLDKAFKAKTDFYKMCLENKDIKAIGFTDTPDFSVKRPSFTQHISKEKIRPLPSDFVLYDAIIVSPVDIDVDQVWRFQDSVTKNALSAYMRDENFKQAFLSGKYPLKKSNLDDRVIMMLEYKKQERNGEVEKKETCVHVVYSFNGEEITPLPEFQPMGTVINALEVLPLENFWNT